MKDHERNWALIKKSIPGKTNAQIRTHSQNFFAKIEKLNGVKDPIEFIKSHPISFFLTKEYLNTSFLKDDECKNLQKINDKEEKESESNESVEEENPINPIITLEAMAEEDKKKNADNEMQNNIVKITKELNNESINLNESNGYKKEENILEGKRRIKKDSWRGCNKRYKYSEENNDCESHNIPENSQIQPQFPQSKQSSNLLSDNVIRIPYLPQIPCLNHIDDHNNTPVPLYSQTFTEITKRLRMMMQRVSNMLGKLEGEYHITASIIESDPGYKKYWNILHKSSISLKNMVNDIAYIHLNTPQIPSIQPNYYFQGEPSLNSPPKRPPSLFN